MQGKHLSFYEFTLMRFSEINKYLINNAMLGYAVPPLETAGTVVLMISTGTIASLTVAHGWSSTDLSSTDLPSIGLQSSDSASIGLATSGLSSFGCSSSVGTGNGSNLTVPEMVDKLEISFVQSHRICWFAPS